MMMGQFSLATELLIGLSLIVIGAIGIKVGGND